MKESYVGKELVNLQDETYLILNELVYKNIKCVFAQKKGTEDRCFFQLSDDDVPKLIAINSEKLLDSLSKELLEESRKDNKPRKIGENESIADYLAYLDDFYKGQLSTII